jgi:nitroreductase/dihydropteridine reductase
MELLKSLEWRYATKKMNGKPVNEDQVEQVLKAIQLAPTSMGLQPFTVLVVKDLSLREKIKNVAYQQSQITDGSHVLVFAAWSNISVEQVDAYLNNIAQTRGVEVSSLDGFRKNMVDLITKQSEEQNFQWAARQTYIAFGTAIAAAAELRIDATPMEGFDPAAVDEILGLKELGLRSVTLLPLGYRDEEQDWLSKAPKVRRDKKELFLELA